jgi:hypothetical protein
VPASSVDLDLAQTRRPSSRHLSSMISGHMDFDLEPPRKDRVCGAPPPGEAIWSENVAKIREALRLLGLTIAQVDRELRYVWIDNPHPDFDPRTVLGKCDDELIPREEAAPLMALKREVMASGVPRTRLLAFERSDGRHYYNVSAVPIRDAAGNVTAALTAAVHVKASA